MKYLCPFYFEEKKLAALPKGELDALVGEHLAYDDELRKSGHFIVAGGLRPVQTATANDSDYGPGPCPAARPR